MATIMSFSYGFKEFMLRKCSYSPVYKFTNSCLKIFIFYGIYQYIYLILYPQNI